MGLTDLLAGDPVEVAPQLLGRRLVSMVGGSPASVTISEVEAYDGTNDPASHAYRGRSPRTASMFGPPGTLYVYRSYGIHWCMNVTCRPEGVAAAVLLRGGVPIDGIDAMVARRGRDDHLTDGPGKLCQALGVTGDLDGVTVTEGLLRIEGDPARGSFSATPRIGISKATERPWRFVLD